MNSTYRVVVVESDPALRKSLRETIDDDEYLLIEANSAATFLNFGPNLTLDLLVADLDLPDMEGVQFIRAFREMSTRPLLVLTSSRDERLIVDIFNAGADDMMLKPFRPGELQARIRALIRRSAGIGKPGTEMVIQAGPLTIDLGRRRVTMNQQSVDLTQREFSLLTVLARNAGKGVSQQTLLEEVWGQEHADDSTYVRMYIARLRNKLEPDRNQPVFLQTVPGGYMFIDSGKLQ